MKKIFFLIASQRKLFVAALSLILLLNGCASTTDSNVQSTITSGNTNTVRTYQCDYQTVSLLTKITTEIDGMKVEIKGNLALFTDPLTMYDENETEMSYAGDSYGIIRQDSHGIYENGNFIANMIGQIDLLGETYLLVDENGDEIANIDFNATSTYGEIIDQAGNVICEYNSSFLLNDYTVTCYENELFSDVSLLMIVASYVSDYQADHHN